MAVPIFASRWLAWPSRIALLLGIGAVSAAGAEASQANLQRTGPESSNELRIWSEGGRIYLAETGQPGRELRLGDTDEARRLKALLQQNSAPGAGGDVRLDRILLAGGGGSGFNWTPPPRTGPVTKGPAAKSPAMARGNGLKKPAASSAPNNTGKARSADKD